MELSFIIPAYNEEAAIGGCIESIQHAIARAGIEAEIIVADNASTDATRDIAGRLSGVRVVSESWKGPNRARQAGFRVASGELIANIDSDGRLPEAWLPAILKRFKEDPALVGLSGPYIFHDLPFASRTLAYSFEVIGHAMNTLIRWIFGSGGMFMGGNCVIRKDALTQIGGYNTAIDFYGDDVDTAKRLSAVGKVRFSLRVPIYSSGRRFARDGVLRVNVRYVSNYLRKMFGGSEAPQSYTDVRAPASASQKSSENPQ